MFSYANNFGNESTVTPNDHFWSLIGHMALLSKEEPHALVIESKLVNLTEILQFLLCE